MSTIRVILPRPTCYALRKNNYFFKYSYSFYKQKCKQSHRLIPASADNLTKQLFFQTVKSKIGRGYGHNQQLAVLEGNTQQAEGLTLEEKIFIKSTSLSPSPRHTLD